MFSHPPPPGSEGAGELIKDASFKALPHPPESESQRDLTKNPHFTSFPDEVFCLFVFCFFKLYIIVLVLPNAR